MGGRGQSWDLSDGPTSGTLLNRIIQIDKKGNDNIKEKEDNESHTHSHTLAATTR